MKRLILLILLPCCARVVVVHDEYACVQRDAKQRTGECAYWQRTAEETCWFRQEIRCIVEEGLLNRDEAVSIALANNRALQAEFETLGIAKSDLVQAGLFTNPNLDFIWRFPFPQDATGLFTLTDLFQVPLRRKIAARQLEITSISLTDQILMTIMEAKKAYNQRLYTAERIKWMREIVDDTKELRDLIDYREGWGYSNPLQRYQAAAMAADQVIALFEAERGAKMATLDLRLALGLDESFPHLRLSDDLALPNSTLPSREALLAKARACRPDLQILQLKIAQAKKRWELARVRWLRRFQLGAGWERDSDVNGVGPAISLEVPLFDQNQAQISKARYQLRRLVKQLSQRQLEIATELKMAMKRYQITRDQIDELLNDVIPNLQRGADYAENYWESRQVNLVTGIETELAIKRSRLMALDLLMEALDALLDIEYLVGGSALIRLAE